MVAFATSKPTKLFIQRALLQRERESFNANLVMNENGHRSCAMNRELSSLGEFITRPCQSGGKDKTPGVLSLGILR